MQARAMVITMNFLLKLFFIFLQGYTANKIILRKNLERMNKSLFSGVDASIICVVLFVLMLCAILVGSKMREKFWRAGDADTKGGINSLLGALFGLWGFMLAFTFNQSGTRFENVRSMIVDEGNGLRNVILRADVFPDTVRDGYRADLQKYLEERIAYYDYANDEARFNSNREALSKTGAALWSRTVQQARIPQYLLHANNMAAALTNLFDLGIKREALLSYGIPGPITFILMVLALAICLVGGFTTPSIKRKEWILAAMFALLASTILYITIDLARPMDGFIKPDSGQQVIVNLRRFF